MVPSHMEGGSSLYIYPFPIMIQDTDEGKCWLEWQVSVTQCNLSTHSTLFPISSTQSCPLMSFLSSCLPPPHYTISFSFPSGQEFFLFLGMGNTFFSHTSFFKHASSKSPCVLEKQKELEYLYIESWDLLVWGQQSFQQILGGKEGSKNRDAEICLCTMRVPRDMRGAMITSATS